MTEKIPLSFQIATTNITVPILGELNRFTDDLHSLFDIFDKVTRIFHYIALIGTGSTGVLSAAAIFLPSSLFIAHMAVIVSLLGSATQTFSSVFITIIIVYVTRKVNEYGNLLGIFVRRGDDLLIITWVAWVISQLMALYWDIVWFVELRNTALKRRARTKSEKGDYNGIWKEIKRDWKKKNIESDDMDEVLIKRESQKLTDRRVEVRREEVKDGEPGTFRYIVSAVPHVEEPKMTGALDRA